MKVIIFQSKEGTVSVVNSTSEEELNRIKDMVVPKDTVYRFIESSELPWQNNDFYNAWEFDGTNIVINMDKAREIKKKQLRIEREPLFAKLDVSFQRALETNSDTTEIVLEKERLRNITLLANEATNLDELRAIHC